MKKLIQGILEYRKNLTPQQRDNFAKLALGQKPDALFIACSDSRVVPNLFASTNPGDLFVTRNVGNIVPCCSSDSHPETSEHSELAALEFSIENLKVKDIVVCGHSECGAMAALLDGREKLPLKAVKNWLSHADDAFEHKEKLNFDDPEISQVNKLSQGNVLTQLEHLKTYPSIVKKLASKQLQLHGLWFDIKAAEVLIYRDVKNKFVPLNEDHAKEIFSVLEY